MTWFSNALGSWWLWGGFAAAIPTAIILLYFLKLKRQPLEVPSTYLWTRTIEDLHVNSIWQRLRRSLLLLLQLLVVGLVMFALLRPGWDSRALSGDRFIFLIDASASMAANDVAPSRLREAVRQASEMIDGMSASDVGMVISFSDVARVEQPFTNNRSLLKQALAGIEQTDRPTELSEALRAAAGLANPGRAAPDETDVAAPDAQPATLYLFSDGGFANVPTFSLGNLTPVYVRIGAPEGRPPRNVAVAAFSASRNPERPDQTQVFGRLENYGESAATVDVELRLNGAVIDAQSVTAEAGDLVGVQFELPGFEQGALSLHVGGGDDLPVDDAAFAAINSPRRARVLLVTPRNDPLVFALSTDEAVKLANVTRVAPNVLPPADAAAGSLSDAQRKYVQEALSGAYDLVIYDQCAPAEMPQANTLFIGRAPPLESWVAGTEKAPPLVIDIERAHPLMQSVNLDNVAIVEAFPITPPRGGVTLIDADIGPIMAIAPREGFEDAVMSFEIFSTGENGDVLVNTDWLKRLSFPLFVRNVIEYLGGARDALESLTVRPGEPVALRAESPAETLYITPPGGSASVPVRREREDTFVFGATEKTGFYEVREQAGAGDVLQRFAVNLFDSRESDLRPRASVELGAVEVAAAGGYQSRRQETWKWLLLAGLAVLLGEWYVYNRRVYV